MGSDYKRNKPRTPHTLHRALLLPRGHPQHPKLNVWVCFGETISCCPAGHLHTSAVTATKTRCESTLKPHVHLAGTFTSMVCALSSLWELITSASCSNVVRSWHRASDEEKPFSLYWLGFDLPHLFVQRPFIMTRLRGGSANWTTHSHVSQGCSGLRL